MLILREENGQSILEYLMAVLIVIVVLAALVSVWDGHKRSALKSDSMLGETIMATPYTSRSSLGISGQGAKDVLGH